MIVVRNVIRSGIAATNAHARTLLSDIGSSPRQGKIARLIFHVSAIAGSASFTKVTLGHKNTDNRYILPVATGAWEVDAGDATLATLILDVDKAFVINDAQLADTTNYAGWYIGLTLDAGTATVEVVLTFRE